MSLLSRLRDWFDDPRYCPDCGKTIVVVDAGGFNEKTGAPEHLWYWTCPDTHISVYLFPSGGSEVTRYGGERHVWGRGRPRWAALVQPFVDAGLGEWVEEAP
jgi:hypothetical protein